MKVSVTLFKPSGKYYTQEEWEVPEDGALGPQDMLRSPDFRRIDNGAVLVDGPPWGCPHLFPAVSDRPTFREVHERRARELVSQVDIRVQQGHGVGPEGVNLLALAQVHATLAQIGE